MTKICKFGGTSMADGTTMGRVKRIVECDPSRRFIVVSAPGRRFSGELKVTDLLYATHVSVLAAGSCGESFERVKRRFRGIAGELKIEIDVEELLERTQQEILREMDEAFTASRGEYLIGRLAAAYFKIPFLDPKFFIRFHRGGGLDAEKTYAFTAEALKGVERAVIPGFYGADEDGKIVTFSRGGSDITGAIVARATGADLYENWTDVSGFLVCDPRIVENPAQIKTLTYGELRELSYMGASVLHVESIFPVKEAGIPVCVKNTFRPEDGGTMIVPASGYRGRQVITGIAGRKPFTAICIQKEFMNGEVGFVRKVLSVLEENGISFEHLPSRVDSVVLVIDDAQLKGGRLKKVLGEIEAAVLPDSVQVREGIALITVVGHGMKGNFGAVARVFRAIALAGVDVRIMSRGFAEPDLIIGVDGSDYERTLCAIYDEFFRD